MFGAVGFFEEVDTFDMEDQAQQNLDLSFLETTENLEDVFGINESFFESLESLTPKRSLIPTLKESVFVETVQHAIWNSENWPDTTKHFPK